MGAPTSTLTLRRGKERHFRGAPNSSTVSPGGEGLAGGGIDAPRVVFISQKMPRMPEAQAGVRRSPCAAVTNTAPPPLPPPSPFLPSLVIRRRRQRQFWEGVGARWSGPQLPHLPYGPVKTGGAAPGTPESFYLPSAPKPRPFSGQDPGVRLPSPGVCRRKM